MTRPSTSFVCILSLSVVIGCGGSETTPTKTGDRGANDRGGGGRTPADSSPPVAGVTKKWSDAEAFLAEAPEVELVPTEIAWNEQESFVADVPRGTIVNTEGLARYEFALQYEGIRAMFQVGGHDLGSKRSEVAGWAKYGAEVTGFPLVTPDFLVYELEAGNGVAGEFNFAVGPRDWHVELESLTRGKRPQFPTEKAALLLKCARTLRPKTPYPENPIELAERLDLRLEKNGDGEVVVAHFGTNISGRVLELAEQFPQLEAAVVDDTYLRTESAYAPLAKVPNLKRLRMGSGNPPPAGAFRVIAACKKLEDLDFSVGSETTAEDLRQIAGLGALRRLDLGIIPDRALPALNAFGSLSDLEHLALTFSVFGPDPDRVHDPDLAFVAKLQNLKSLELSGSIGDLSGIGSLSNLESLEVRSPLLTDDGIRALAGLTKLRSLDLEGPLYEWEKLDCTGAGFADLGTLTLLEEVDLEQIPITDEGLAHIAALPALNDLRLSRTLVSTLVPLQGVDPLRLKLNRNEKLSDTAVEAFKKAVPHVKFPRF